MIFISSTIKIFIFYFKSLLNKFGITLTFSSDGEDSVLIKWLGGIKNGFYVDIGSHKPLFSSNTYGFYLLGWKGICIDPNPGLKLKYKIFRSSDLFINSALVFDKKKRMYSTIINTIPI